jgi:hypothetical protein
VKYDAISNEWYGVNATNDTFTRAGFVGFSGFENWVTTTELTGGLTSGHVVWDFAPGNASDIFAVSDGSNKSWIYAAGVWTKVSLAVIGVSSYTKPNVSFEPVSGNWICFTGTGAGTELLFTTPDGLTGTSRTLPTGFNASNTNVTVGVDGLGNAVAVNFDGTNIRFSYSTDGGVTWSASTSAALGFASGGFGAQGRFCTPIWNGSMWMVVATKSTFSQSAVYVSNDGVTWTLQSSQGGAAVALQNLKNIGDLWVATNTAGNLLLFSVDSGVTWHKTGQCFLGSFAFFHTDGNRFLLGIDSTTNMWASVATGLGF